MARELLGCIFNKIMEKGSSSNSLSKTVNFINLVSYLPIVTSSPCSIKCYEGAQRRSP